MPTTELSHFNVFTDPYTTDPRPIFNDVRSSVHPFYRAPDERVLVTSRKYPDGAHYRFGREMRHHEIFYIVEGAVTCTPAGGSPVVLRRGEVVHFPPGFEAEWQYTTNSQHLAFFWGDDPIELTAPRPKG
jgi:uncharacterized cupin superfamily protein